MGGSVSSGKDNDELTDNLVDCDYIVTKSVENVFRTVDRGTYFPPNQRRTAYTDTAWRSGALHLSAPSIYCRAMESLQLQRGNSFLNMGSGTGYLSTMAGLIIGATSTSCNHGIEYRHAAVRHANEKLEEFILTSQSFDEYDFCIPQFFTGNCLKMTTNIKYDRIYCGAECSDDGKEYIKGHLNIGGIAVFPHASQLLQIKRMSTNEFSEVPLASVSFADLFLPTDEDKDVKLPDFEVPSLKSMSRTAIRGHLRQKMFKRLGDLNQIKITSPEEKSRELSVKRRSSSLAGGSSSMDSQNERKSSGTENGLRSDLTAEMSTSDRENDSSDDSMSDRSPSDTETNSNINSNNSLAMSANEHCVSSSTKHTRFTLISSSSSDSSPSSTRCSNSSTSYATAESGSLTSPETSSNQMVASPSSSTGTQLPTEAETDSSTVQNGNADQSTVHRKTNCSCQKDQSEGQVEGQDDDAFLSKRLNACCACRSGTLTPQHPSTASTSNSQSASSHSASHQPDTPAAIDDPSATAGNMVDSEDEQPTEDQAEEERSAQDEPMVVEDEPIMVHRLSDVDTNSSDSDSDSDSSGESDDNEHRLNRARRARRLAMMTLMADAPEPKISREEELERMHNKERARQYRIAFSHAMSTSIGSLPIPTSLKDYLMYYRSNKSLIKTI